MEYTMDKETEHEEIYYKVGDAVWRKAGYYYQRATITEIDGEKVTLGNKEATIDDILPVSVFAVPEEVNGLAFETHVYDYLVFRTYESGRIMDISAREKTEGLYIEKPVCDTYRRQHFPGHASRRADVLRLLAELEEQA
jgi:hypothetical protein